jgi:acyl-CoA hydrolase
MKNWSQMYKEKFISATEAAKMVKPGDWVDIGMFNGKSVAFERELAARKDELSDIVVYAGITLLPIPEVLMKDPMGDVFTYVDYHFSPLSRIIQEKRGNVFYNPTQFGESEGWFESKLTDPDKIGTRLRELAVVRVAPMDKDGYFNFGLQNGITLALLKTAKKCIVEICQGMPYCYGGARESIHISEVDYVIDEDSPVMEMPPTEPTDIDRQIAGHVLPYIHDGSTIQLGIGGMPNALGTIICETDLKNLGGHTEMLGESYMRMIESGKMNNSKKNLDCGKTVYTFAAGTKKLYEWMDHNSALASYNVFYVNNPINVAKIDNLISINQALEVDLYNQVSAESSAFKQISGNGGMLDFVLGSFYSNGGRSLICLPSTHTDKKGNVVSRIVPAFEAGTITTVPRQSVNIIVTEYGSVSLKGDSTWIRAEKIISIAHPDFREGLIKAAEKRKIWRHSNKIA